VVAAIGPAVYEVGTRALEEVVGEQLKARNLQLAVAESCTGGLIGDRVTDIPGSSAYFRGGVTAYANEVKTGVLGVGQETLGRHGAVSRKTVIEMARGVCRVLDADVGIAVSGIAGPGGGTSDKPVGLVYVAVVCDGRVQTRQHRFTGTRRMVKERAATAALDLCRRALCTRAGGRK
jgi:nicotinamide-nucleotide amidase